VRSSGNNSLSAN